MTLIGACNPTTHPVPVHVCRPFEPGIAVLLASDALGHGDGFVGVDVVASSSLLYALAGNPKHTCDGNRFLCSTRDGTVNRFCTFFNFYIFSDLLFFARSYQRINHRAVPWGLCSLLDVMHQFTFDCRMSKIGPQIFVQHVPRRLHSDMGSTGHAVEQLCGTFYAHRHR